MVARVGNLLRVWAWTKSWIFRERELRSDDRSVSHTFLAVALSVLTVVAPIGVVAGSMAESVGVPDSSGDFQLTEVPDGSQYHLGSARQYPALWVEVEVDNIVLEYSGDGGGPTGTHLYGSDYEYPDYRVHLGLIHEEGKDLSNHADIAGVAWRDGYNDITYSEPCDECLNRRTYRITKLKQVLFDKEDGIGGKVLINEFDHRDGGWMKANAPRGPKPRSASQRFILAGPDRYEHIHCSPEGKMTASIFVVESDDDSPIDGSLGAGSAALSAAATAYGVSAPISITLTTVTAVGVPVIDYFTDNGDDIVGVGAGELPANGRTEIPINGGRVTNSGNFVTQHPAKVGYITIETRTRPVEEVLATWDAERFQDASLLEMAPDDFKNLHLCANDSDKSRINPPVNDSVDPALPVGLPLPDWDSDTDRPFGPAEQPTPGQTGTDTSEQSTYDYESFRSAIGLAIRLEEDGLPVDAIPRDQRSLVTDGVNLRVGSAPLGMKFDRRGTLKRTVPGELQNVGVTVTMEPEVARALAHTPDIQFALWAGIEGGDIRVRGNGAGNAVMVTAAKTGLMTQRLSDSASLRVSYAFPNRYSIAPGESTQIKWGGETVTLRRNALGTRIIDRSGPGEDLIVVDRGGREIGVATKGAQRLVGLETPDRWRSFSGQQAGVYDQRRTQQARQAAAYERGAL